MTFWVRQLLCQWVRIGVQRPVELVGRTVLALVLLVVLWVCCVARLENGVSLDLGKIRENGLE
jgi:hypothetical protein